jgi:hypothetical protein
MPEWVLDYVDPARDDLQLGNKRPDSMAGALVWLADRCEALEREKTQLRARLDAAVRERDALRHAGGLLSNCAYNLAQRDTLDADTRRTLDECRKAWDAAIPPSPEGAA